MGSFALPNSRKVIQLIWISENLPYSLLSSIIWAKPIEEKVSTISKRTLWNVSESKTEGKKTIKKNEESSN